MIFCRGTGENITDGYDENDKRYEKGDNERKGISHQGRGTSSVSESGHKKNIYGNNRYLEYTQKPIGIKEK